MPRRKTPNTGYAAERGRIESIAISIRAEEAIEAAVMELARNPGSQDSIISAIKILADTERRLQRQQEILRGIRDAG